HAVEIADRALVGWHGSIAELSAEGKPTVLIATRDELAALELLNRHPCVENATGTDDGIRVTLRTDANINAASADILRHLIDGRIAVHRLEPARASLEQRFLEITSRLEVTT